MFFDIVSDLQKFDALKNPEVNEFRGKMKALCDEVVASRNKLTWSERVRIEIVHVLMYKGFLYIFVQFSMLGNTIINFIFIQCVY